MRSSTSISRCLEETFDLGECGVDSTGHLASYSSLRDCAYGAILTNVRLRGNEILYGDVMVSKGQLRRPVR